MNVLTLTDGYKVDHRRQYPKGTTLVYSNWTPRKSRIPGVEGVVFFGLQYFMKKYLIEDFQNQFFSRPLSEVLPKYKRRIENYLGKDAITYEHIEALHSLGYLPLRIKALPEGTLVPFKVPMFTVENTLPEFFWLTNFLETMMSCVLWLPCTSATTAYRYKKLLDGFAMKTVGDKEFVPFQAHDFSFRGMAGVEAAMLSGAGHLLSFVGTDSIPAIDFLEEYYEADSDKEMVGCSVPATEHSTMSMGTELNELETFRRLITEVYPRGIVSIVADTWDFWKVITEYLPKLKEEILSRDGKVVIRPDSGDPVSIICGDLESPFDSPEGKGAVRCLWEVFGGTITEKGYAELDSHIGLIYGDSITYERCEQICSRLERQSFASTNVVFGVGSFTYQYVTRDTFGFAMKATYGEVNGEPREIYKAPKTDDGTKVSARGLLAVRRNAEGKLVLTDRVTKEDALMSEMATVFLDSKIVRKVTLSEVRETLGQESK